MVIAVPGSAIRSRSLDRSSFRHGTQKHAKEFAQELIELSLK